MKPLKKITKSYDKRQYEYQQTVSRLKNSKNAAAYRRPGSRNPKKARG